MSDIRNFFSAKPKKGGSSDDNTATKMKNESTAKRRPKPLISSSDDDDDFVATTPQPTVSKKSRNGKKDSDLAKDCPEKQKSPSKEKAMKAVDAKDFFAAAATTTKHSSSRPAKSSEKKKSTSPNENKGSRANGKDKTDKTKKRKSPDVEFHDDADFAAMLVDMDTNPESVTPSPMKKTKIESSDKPASKLAKLKGQVEDDAKASNGFKAKEKVKDKEKSPKVKSPKKFDEKPSENKKKVETGLKSPEKCDETPSEPKRKVEAVKKASPVKTDKVSVKAKEDPVDKKSQEKPAKIVYSVKSEAPEISKPKFEGEAESGESQLWVDKYKPANVKSIIGQQGDKSNMTKLINWLRNWDNNHGPGSGKPPPRPPPWGAHNDNGFWAKAALLSGSPGVGKTTTAYLVAKELGYEVTELNASDTRSKKQLDSVVADALGTRWVTNTSAKKILLMDEVDGMAGNEDRGGVGELIQLMKGSRIPIVCMCNDRNHQKIRNLANHCFDLRFNKPRVEQIKAAMMSVCFKEKIKIAPDALTDLIVGCNQDIRQVLHQLSMLKAKSAGVESEKLTAADIKSETERSQKTSIKMGPWDVCRKVFSASDHKSMSLMDKSDLFFHDYSLGPLFVQENYLNAVPSVGENDKKKHMLLLSKASDSLCDGDLVEATLRSRNSWNLLPTQAMFASVIPGEFLSGYMKGQIQFPSWLGKYSKQNKMDRLLQEVQIHTRLSANLSKQALNRDFVQPLRDAIIRPLAAEGADGVSASVQVMEEYALLREDLDNILELAQWPDAPDPMRAVESKVKAAFTRAYNKQVFLPYSTNVGNVAKKASKAIESDPAANEGEVEEDDDNDDDQDIGKDSMIKAKKKAGGKSDDGKATKGRGRAAATKATKTDSTSEKGKGRGKGKKK